MNTYLEQVKEFHETFNHPVSSFKNDIDLKTRQLRIKLLFEELEELSVASDVKKTFNDLCLEVVDKADENNWNFEDGSDINKKEELDALADIQYVLSGAVLSLGYQEVFDAAFNEVHSSNMSKACATEQEAILTEQHYLAKSGILSYHIEKDGRYLVFRKSDDKTLKNINYNPANLEQFLK